VGLGFRCFILLGWKIAEFYKRIGVIVDKKNNEREQGGVGARLGRPAVRLSAGGSLQYAGDRCMMVAGFAAVYFFLTYAWWDAYSEQLYGIPTYQTILGFGLLLILGARAVMTPPVVLGLAAISAALHLNKDQWNPFHSGYVAGAITVLGVLGTVAFMGGNPIQWVQEPNHAGGTSFLAVAAMSVTTVATIRTKNPLRHVTVLSGLHKERGGIQDIAREPSPQPTEQQAAQSQPATDSRASEVDVDEVRADPEVNPFEDTPEDETGSDDVDDTPSDVDAVDEQQEQQTTDDADTDENDDMSADTTDSTDADNSSEESDSGIENFEFPWEEPPETRFQNIGGYAEVKEDLREQVVAPLREDADSYERFGVEPSRGILFHGPPGTGKTLFARALANEMNRPFVELNQADLTHEYVNKSPQIISRLFEEAQELGGVIFIDEAEQLLGGRGGGMNNHAEDQKITNTFLSGLTQEDQDFIVLLTTNRRDAMDDAILRPGRVDEEFEIGMPNVEARKKILKVKLAEVPHKLTLDHVETVAGKTEGWSGADLNNLVNRAKIEAAGRGAEYLRLEDIQVGYEEAKTANH